MTFGVEDFQVAPAFVFFVGVLVEEGDEGECRRPFGGVGQDGYGIVGVGQVGDLLFGLVYVRLLLDQSGHSREISLLEISEEGLDVFLSVAHPSFMLGVFFQL